MNVQKLTRDLKAARTVRNISLIVGCVLLAANVMLAMKLARESNQVVLVPTAVSDGMVARGNYDKRYLEALALDTVYGLYNASPASLDYGRTVIERVASAKHRGLLLKRYDEVADDIREREISTVFSVHLIEHKPQSLEVTVEGSLETYVDTVRIASEPRKIKLQFTYEAGSVRLVSVSKMEEAK